MKITDIKTIFPLIGYENGCLISKDGDISVVMRLTLPEAYNIDKDGYEAIHGFWLKAISVLPDRTIVHKQDIFYRKDYSGKFTPQQSLLDRCYELHFNEREYLEHESFLILTYCTEERLDGRSNYSTLYRRSIIPQDITAETVDIFLDKVENFKSILSLAIGIENVTEEELLGTKSDTGILERYVSVGYENPNLLKDIEFDRNRIMIYSICSNDMMPCEVSPTRSVSRYSTDVTSMLLSFASHLAVECHCNHIYNQYLFLENSERTLRKMESDLRNMKSLSKYSRSNRINAELLEKFLNDSHHSDQRIVKAHFNVMSWAEDDSQLRKNRNIISSCIGSMGISVHLSTIEAPLLFWAGIAGNAADIPSEESFYITPSAALCMFNEESTYKDFADGFGIKLSDRDSGKPLLVDLSDLPMKKGYISNRNKFVLGPSGTGKSFFMNHMLRSYYEQGASIVLIDMGNSYQGLSSLIRCESENKDGHYITYTDKDRISFNPFRRSDGLWDDETVNNLRALLVTLWKKEDEPIVMIEENFLSEMIVRYLKKDGAKGSFNGFYSYIQRCMPKDGTRKTIAENFLLVLSPYYKGGQYDFLLNSDTVTAESLINDRFVVFEIDSIKDNLILMTITSIVIMEMFITKMKMQKGMRKVFVIEEAWRALATERMASYIKYLYKTIRKYYGEAIIVTQEIDDVISSSIVRESIINNSDCKILMDQSRYVNRFSEIQSFMGISEKQKAEILSINQSKNPVLGRYNELWIGLGGRFSKVYSLEVSKEEYYTYTTEEKEKKRVTELAQSCGSFSEAIKQIINHEN